MQVALEHASNPDIDKNGGYWQQPLDPKRRRLVTVQTFREASTTCRTYIDRNGLGGGNWTGGDILDDNQRVIARVSYNGRVWRPDDTEIEDLDGNTA